MKKKLVQHAVYEEGIEYQFVEPVKLGPIISYGLQHDPIHMSFVLSRYKFVARMLAGKKRALEIGCADGFGTPIVAQHVDALVAIDIDDRLIQSDHERLTFLKNVTFQTMEFGKELPRGKFDAAYCVDVFEHLDPPIVKGFLDGVAKVLSPQGIFLLGTPNVTSAPYASPQSAVQHINLQSHKTLRENLEKYFHNVFIFSMNDEVVHTGYFPMAHYLWGMGVGVR